MVNESVQNAFVSLQQLFERACNTVANDLKKSDLRAKEIGFESLQKPALTAYKTGFQSWQRTFESLHKVFESLKNVN